MCVCLRFLQACGRRGLAREGGGGVTGQEGCTPGVLRPAIFGAQGFRDVFMSSGVKGLRKGLAPKFSPVSLCYFRTVNIAYEYTEIIAGWMSYCVLILTLHFTGIMCWKLISRSVVFICIFMTFTKHCLMFRKCGDKTVNKTVSALLELTEIS